VDRPQLNYGGWINNRLEPDTTYYYRIAAVDRWNNEGPLSPPVAVTTCKSSEWNMVPLRVECLRAIPVSPLSRFNVINLMWRTNCESDVKRYEIHRSTRPAFKSDSSTRIGIADADAVIKGGNAYGQVPFDQRMGDYDHMMFLDETVQPETTYYYKVRAVDTAGQPGPFSSEATARTKPASPTTGVKASAQSIYAAEYPADNAIDGDPDPYRAWISKPYGSGSKQAPGDTWLVVELPRKLTLKGVTVMGDARPVIPLQQNLRIDCRAGGAWTTVANVRGATERNIKASWAPRETDAVRVFVPVADLPKSTLAEQDGIVRICELMLVLADGREVTVEEGLAAGARR
jgi:hypothetical protein